MNVAGKKTRTTPFRRVVGWATAVVMMGVAVFCLAAYPLNQTMGTRALSLNEEAVLAQSVPLLSKEAFPLLRRDVVEASESVRQEGSGRSFQKMLTLLAVAAFPTQMSYDSPMVGLLLVCVVFFAFFGVVTSKTKRHAFVACALLVVLGLQSFSSAMFHADRYHALLGPEKEAPLRDFLPVLNLQDAPLVSHDMALLAARRRLLAELPKKDSSQLNGMRKQLVNGKLVWVGFLEHKGYMAWRERRTTPGYVQVNAHDVTDVSFVRTIDQKPLALRYLSTGYFEDSIKQHLRLNGHWGKGLGESAYEIDDQGKPWAVVKTFERSIGWMGKTSTGVLLVDVQTGDIREYEKNKVPSWIDQVEAEDLVAQHIDQRLRYAKGWFQARGEDELFVSGGLDLIHVNGQSHWMAAIASTGKESRIVRFLTVNTRTKEVHRHEGMVVSEELARYKIENVLAENKYGSGNALPFLINGEPAYVMPLRDNFDNPWPRHPTEAWPLNASYGIMAMGNAQHIATGDNLAETVQRFQRGAGAKESL